MQHKITPEEFADWQDHPITKWVFDAVRTGADAQQKAWLDASWDRGKCDPLMLCELRTRADAYRALFETTYDDWVGLHEHPQA